MNKRSKIILVLSFVIVFAFSLSINIFADSAVYGDTELKPVFAPVYVDVYDYDSDIHILTSAYSNMIVSLDPDNIDYTVYGAIVLNDFEQSDMVSREFYLGFPNDYSTNNYYFEFGDRFLYHDLWDNFVLKFNDFYFDSSFPRLLDCYDVLISFDENYSVISYGLDCEISYIDNGTLVSETLNFEGATYRDVIDNFNLYLIESHSDGALVQNIVLYDSESSGRFGLISLNGDIVYTLGSIPTGPDAALLNWYNDFGVGSSSHPTILESVTRGLNAVWDTSLFGLFTIGQVFSACAGVALFTWLLKIFNR